MLFSCSEFINSKRKYVLSTNNVSDTILGSQAGKVEIVFFVRLFFQCGPNHMLFSLCNFDTSPVEKEGSIFFPHELHGLQTMPELMLFDS